MSSNRWLSDYDIQLFGEGSHLRTFEKLGAHPGAVDGQRGVFFAVWAPNARRVSVVGDFNNWDELATSLVPVGSGLWEGFAPGAAPGHAYKYSMHSQVSERHLLKADPYASYTEVPPRSASVIWDIADYRWSDADWMRERGDRHRLSAPLSVYELHLGSWRRKPEEGGNYLSYRELAEQLPGYVRDMGFTHVEFLPIAEHPFDGSWGYQPLGFFAPTSRFGPPQDLMLLVDRLHQAGIGVIADFVLASFPDDPHGLASFDGGLLYEEEGRRPEKGRGLRFGFGRPQVDNFLISSALFWLEKFHLDGLRIAGLESVLYAGDARDDVDSTAAERPRRENPQCVAFLRRLNEAVYQAFPDVFTAAQEASAWPMVSRPTYNGGLGFGYKWNTGWSNDVLQYMANDPVHRSYHHNNLTFGLLYAFHENFILPFAHDDVAGGKHSLLRRMSGDEWQKFANVRLLFGYQFGHPGKKLLFMGDEFAQWDEWDANRSLDWHLLQYPRHRGVQAWVRDLNHVLCTEPALYEADFSEEGFCWIDCHDHLQSVVSFIRRTARAADTVICLYNFTPVPRHHYRVGVPSAGYWEELLNSDAEQYGGSGVGNLGGVFSESIPAFGQPFSLSVTLPPLAAVFLRLTRG